MMLLLALYSIFHYTTVIQAQCTTSCPSSFTSNLNSCWYFSSKISPKRGTFDQIEAWCQSLNPTAHIMSITSLAESTYIIGQAVGYFFWDSSIVFYLGGRGDSAGTYSWVDGSTWSWTSWKSGAVKNAPNTCLIYTVLGWDTGYCGYAKGVSGCKAPQIVTCPSTTKQTGPTTKPTPTIPQTTTPRPACPSSNVYGDFVRASTNGWLGTGLIGQLQTDTVELCGTACLAQSGSCLSFDWNQVTQQCRLLGASNFAMCSQLQPDDDYIHYDLIGGNV